MSELANHPILAIDHGEARIGLAATDEFGIGAHPVETIDCRKTEIIARILEVIAERKIKTVVLGLPLRMDRSEGTSAAKVRKFGKQLRTKLGPIPLTYFDESFTTVTASEKLHQAGKNAKKQKAIIDQAAALEILTEYLGW
ncbi:MAG: putative Holliday junction resolvase [Akkermansiaceae bacterium]|jgi:putative Holliday junction resolvase